MTPADEAAAAPGDDAAQWSSLQATLAFLLSPEAHAPGSGPIESIETHLSWLVLDAQQVLKLKKPVCYPPPPGDRSLGAREQDARAEWRLNRRLAPRVYQGVRAVRRASGHLMLQRDAGRAAPDWRGDAGDDNDGATVDWLVQMQRLPADRLLDQAEMARHRQVLTQARFGPAAAPGRHATAAPA